MRLLPKSRRGRAAVAVGLAALLASGVYEYRPWEAHYRGRPTSWWAAWVCDPEFREPRPPAEKLWQEVRARVKGYRPTTTTVVSPLPPGDATAVPVLVELLEWPNAEARMW